MPEIFCFKINLIVIVNRFQYFSDCVVPGLSYRGVEFSSGHCPGALGFIAIMMQSAQLNHMPYKTDRNVIGRQITSAVEEVVTALRIAYDAGMASGSVYVIPAAFTRTDLVSLFAGLPTVTGTQTLDISGTAGNATVTTGEKAVATGKGWTLDVTP